MDKRLNDILSKVEAYDTYYEILYPSEEDEKYVEGIFEKLTKEDIKEIIGCFSYQKYSWMEAAYESIFLHQKWNWRDKEWALKCILETLNTTKETINIYELDYLVLEYYKENGYIPKQDAIDYINIMLKKADIKPYIEDWKEYSFFNILNNIFNISSFKDFEITKKNNKKYPFIEIKTAKENVDLSILGKFKKHLKGKDRKFYYDESINQLGFIIKDKRIKVNITCPYISDNEGNHNIYLKKEKAFNKIAKKQRFYGEIIINSNILFDTLSGIGPFNFQNFNLIELYNLSDIELDFDKEELKDYFFYKPMVIHKSLKEKSVITKDKDKFVYAYVNNKGYLIGYEGDKKEVILPKEFKYDNKIIKEYEIREHAVNNQSEIVKLIIPDNVTKLGPFIFFNQPKLETLILKCNKVEVIPSFAFASCINLKSIYIPKNIKVIEEFAFSACKNLTDIYYEGSKNEWDQIKIIKNDSKYNEDELGKAKVHFNYNINVQLD